VGRGRANVARGNAPLVGFLAVWASLVLVPLAGLVLWSFSTTEGFRITFEPSLAAYQTLFDSGRWEITMRTVRIAATITVFELVFAFPFALWLAKYARSPSLQALTLALLTVPFFLSIAARTIVWRAVLGIDGPINNALLWLGVADEPLRWLLFSEFAVHLGLIGPYFPTMVFPIVLAITMIDDDLIAASRDLGAGWGYTLGHVVVPLALPGIVAGVVFTFVPMLGEDVVPALLGGGHVTLLGNSVHSSLTALNYAVAAALSVLVLGAMALLIAMFALVMRRAGGVAGAFEALRQ